jgi:ribosomal protein S18 acetylase RimI-like enzyme
VEWDFLEISAKIDVSQFDCGSPELNDFLKRNALQSQQARFSSTYVAVESGKMVTCGYYTLANAQIHFANLLEDKRRGIPAYPLSAIRIARLARDNTWKGKGLGEALLRHAFTLILNQSKTIKTFAVVVDAKDEKAKGTYLGYGFIPYADVPNALYLPLKTIEKAHK